MRSSFPGEPDPFFFGSDESEERKKVKGKEDEKKSVERIDEPKEQVNETKQVHKNSKKSGLGIGFWLNAFTITFVLYLIGIMISQRSVCDC